MRCDELVDATDVIPVVMREPQAGERDAFFAQRGLDRLGLRWVDDDRTAVIDNHVGEVVTKARDHDDAHGRRMAYGRGHVDERDGVARARRPRTLPPSPADPESRPRCRRRARGSRESTRAARLSGEVPLSGFQSTG